MPMGQLAYLGDAEGSSYSGAQLPEVDIQGSSEGPHSCHDENCDKSCQDAVFGGGGAVVIRAGPVESMDPGAEAE